MCESAAVTIWCCCRQVPIDKMKFTSPCGATASKQISRWKIQGKFDFCEENIDPQETQILCGLSTHFALQK
jgi:hypothetical protein